MGIFGGMVTMFADYGVNLEEKRQHLLTCLQDQLENAMWSRLERENTTDQQPALPAEEERREPAPVRSIGRERRSNNNNRRGLEQTAASRERQEDKSKDNWLQDLNPDQKRMLGELLKEFIS